MPTHRTPWQAPTGAGRLTDASPAAAVIPQATHSSQLTGLSATVAGFDGAVITTVARRDESDPADGVLAVVLVSGDVDQDSVPLLHITLTRAIDGNPRVCCDVSEVAFFGAAGANTLLAAHRYAADAGRHFSVRGVHGHTRNVLAITGLDRELTVTA